MTTKMKIENSSEILPHEYGNVLKAIRERIKSAQLKAMTAVNLELIGVYRDIGKTIHEKQQAAEWGTSVVERLATDLQ